MLPTELVKLSPRRAFSGFGNDGSFGSIRACDEISIQLQSCGWALTGSTFATATLWAPFGWGYAGFAGSVAIIGGTAYVFYDPSWQSIPFGFIGTAVISPVPTTGTPQLNLCGAISAGTIFVAIPDGPTTILLTSKVPGSLGNGILVQGGVRGFVSIGSISGGGGWILQSQAQLTPLNTATIKLRAVAGANGATPNALLLRFTVDGYDIDWVPRSGSWGFIASNYQVLFFNLDPYGAVLDVWDTFAWACTPVIDDSQIGVLSFAAFVIRQPNLAADSTLGSTTGAAAMAVDMWSGFLSPSHTAGGYGQRGWSIVMNHSGGSGQPIVDPVGGTIFSEALLAMCNPVSSESRIVGRVPDCFASTIPAAKLAEQMQQGGYGWLAIAVQANPPGTLWMATGATGIPPPDSTPTPKAGSCTSLMGGAGPSTVTWDSGDKFDGSMVGMLVTVTDPSSVFFHVASVASDGLSLVTVETLSDSWGDCPYTC